MVFEQYNINTVSNLDLEIDNSGSQFTHYYNSINNKIIEISEECNFDNWDNEASKAISDVIVINTLYLLQCISDLPTPEVESLPNGNMSLDWISNSDQFFIMVIGEKSIIHFACKLSKTDEIKGSLEFKGKFNSYLSELISSVYDK
jgi:hypothetical protein